jgi:dihydrolipoamide dehydrogenase
MLEADVTIVGAGPGGYACAIRAGQLGLKTVIVEADRVGGECLNYGCIPSKALISASKLFDRARDGQKFGVEAAPVTFDMSRAQKWKSDVVTKEVGGVEMLLKGNHVTVLMGEAEVPGPNRLVVRGSSGQEEVRTKNLVIATGTESVQLPGLEFDGERVIGSREGLELPEVPRRLLVVGGGAIGLEFACMFQRLGTQVTVVEVMDQLLPGSDPEVVRVVQRKLEGRGAKVHLKSKVAGLKKGAPGVAVDVETPAGREAVEVDKVLVSVGRRPRTKGMNLQAIGVVTDQKGFVVTDDRMRTSAPWVFAVGDVRGPPLLAHKATKEGIVAAEVIAGLPSAADWKVIPDAVFCDPEVASAGLTEAKAAQAGYAVKRTRFQFAALGRAVASGEGEGFVKVVSKADDGLVLGVQIVGPEASDLIGEAALAIEMGATVEDIALTIHPHPTFSEALMEASASAAGKPIHQLKL